MLLSRCLAGIRPDFLDLLRGVFFGSVSCLTVRRVNGNHPVWYLVNVVLGHRAASLVCSSAVGGAGMHRIRAPSRRRRCDLSTARIVYSLSAGRRTPRLLRRVGASHDTN